MARTPGRFWGRSCSAPPVIRPCAGWKPASYSVAASMGPRRLDGMSIHRYSLQNLLPDYLRGGAGLIIGGGGWLLAPSALHVIVIFGGLTVLFLLFTMRTVARQ